MVTFICLIGAVCNVLFNMSRAIRIGSQAFDNIWGIVPVTYLVLIYLSLCHIELLYSIFPCAQTVSLLNDDIVDARSTKY